MAKRREWKAARGWGEEEEEEEVGVVAAAATSASSASASAAAAVQLPSSGGLSASGPHSLNARRSRQ